MLGNAVGWIAYSFYVKVSERSRSNHMQKFINTTVLTRFSKQNLFVLMSVLPGFFLSFWFNVCAVKLQYQDRTGRKMKDTIVSYLHQKSIIQFHPPIPKRIDIVKNSSGEESSEEYSYGANIPQQQQETASSFLSEDPEMFMREILSSLSSIEHPPSSPHEMLILAVMMSWLSIFCYIAFSTTLSTSTSLLIVGLAVNANNLIYCAAPLGKIVEIVHVKRSDSIYLPSVVFNTTNALFWMVYGFILWDPLLAFPNIINVSMGMVQVVFCIIYPSGDKKERRTLNEDEAPQTAETDKQPLIPRIIEATKNASYDSFDLTSDIKPASLRSLEEEGSVAPPASPKPFLMKDDATAETEYESASWTGDTIRPEIAMIV